MAAQAIFLKKDFKKVIYSSRLKASQKAVMYYFIDIANPHKNWTCFPSHSKIAKVIGRSISTVKRAIAALIKHGFLAKLAQFKRYGGFQSSNLYTLYLPADTAEMDGQTHINEVRLPQNKPADPEQVEGQLSMEGMDTDKISTEESDINSPDMDIKTIDITIEQDDETDIPDIDLINRNPADNKRLAAIYFNALIQAKKKKKWKFSQFFKKR